MSDMAYNYVIFGLNTDYYIAAYYDIFHLENVRYIGGAMQYTNKTMEMLYRYHTTPRINDYVRLPLKNIYNSRYFVNNFARDLPLCFLFFGYMRGKILEWGYYEYIKKRFPGSKLVCYFQDLVFTNKHLNVNDFRRYFDLILSFDPEDARKYHFLYYPLVYSSRCPFNLSEEYPSGDVFFAGKAKDRLPEIITAFETLRGANLKCDFHIMEVQCADSPYRDEIHYCNYMPYEEYLCRLKAANCNLEIMQRGGRGYTLRASEAIVYRKKLLSNNLELLHAPFYNQSYISVFHDPKHIDIGFAEKREHDINYNFTEPISPVALLRFIERELKK